LALVCNGFRSCGVGFDYSAGTSLLRKLKAATSDMHDHVVNHEEYQLSLPKASVAQWTAEVEAWEKDPSSPNPFEVKVTSE
jgi:hypothetical protein